MIKRIIFDIDNTLLPWRDEYIMAYKNALDEVGIKYTENDLEKIKKAEIDYENHYNIYDRKTMRDFINSRVPFDLPENYVDTYIKYLSFCYREEDKKIIPTLEYLSKKYELVILSNWFRENQENRLKSLGLDKYFIDSYYTDEVLNKPNKEAFIKACGPYKKEECIMIGDNYKIDIEGALNAGLSAILVDPDNKYEYKNKIKNINELEELL